MSSKLLKKCHFRKLLIFIWLVAIFLTTSFLSIGIFTKFREALRGVIEVSQTRINNDVLQGIYMSFKINATISKTIYFV